MNHSPPEAAAASRWSLTFAESDPVSVDFRDDSVHITVRLAGFRSDDRDYPGMEMSVPYRLRLQADRLVMVRDGEFRIYPLGFVSGKQRLSGPQLVTRQVLKRRLEEQVPAEFDLGGFAGPGPRRVWSIDRLLHHRGMAVPGPDRRRELTQPRALIRHGLAALAVNPGGPARAVVH